MFLRGMLYSSINWNTQANLLAAAYRTYTPTAIRQ
jgi:hypothetical protein